MSPANKVLLFGCGAVVGFDALASILSMSLGFQYSSASIGSFLIYAAGGFFAARARSRWYSIGVGIALGLTDATIGWALSWALGPGRTPTGAITFAEWCTVAVVVVVGAAICAGIGGFIGGLTKRSRGAASKPER
jgi:hypothetical protein